MPNLPSWTNNGPVQYDYAITGLDSDNIAESIPLLSGASTEYPYLRETADFRKDQIDTTTEPGEQSLQNWWVRAQSSFDLGAGIKFMDPVQDPLLARRFADSCGVDVFEPGQVTLLRKCTMAGPGTAASPDNGNHRAIGFSTGEQNGVLYSDGGKLRQITVGTGVNDWVKWVAPGDDTGNDIKDLATNGGAFYVATEDGIYYGALPSDITDLAGPGTKIWDFPGSPSNVKIGFAKQSLIAGVNTKLYRLDPSPEDVPSGSGFSVTSEEDGAQLVWDNKISGWEWTAFADGPTAIYAAGYAGDYSAIYAVGLTQSARYSQWDSTNTLPTLATPMNVAELPSGERVLSMIVYLGTYAVIGTNLGVRVAIIDTNGGLILGPLTLRSDNPVRALFAKDNFVWAGGAVMRRQVLDGQGKVTYSSGLPVTEARLGLYRIDLSKTVGQNTLEFPWAKDIFATGEPTGVSDKTRLRIRSIVAVGDTGRIGFTVDNFGFILEHENERVDSGWIETGAIRYDTNEEKIYQFVRALTRPAGGKISIAWRSESNAVAELAHYETGAVGSVPGIRAYETDGSDALPHPWISYRFTLHAKKESGSDDDNPGLPTFLGYQVKGQPALVRQRNIRLTALCMPRETTITGKTVERSVRDRIKKLERAEERNAVVRFQDLGTGEDRLCIIDRIQFVGSGIPETRMAQAEPGGLLLITLRTIA